MVVNWIQYVVATDIGFEFVVPISLMANTSLKSNICRQNVIHLNEIHDFYFSFCSESDIKHDSYLVPFTMYELGLLHKQKGDINTAITVIENAKCVFFLLRKGTTVRVASVPLYYTNG